MIKNIKSDKLIFIPNAADFSIANNLTNDLNFCPSDFKKEIGLEDSFVITYVGAHGVANHLIQLIKAAEYLKSLI